MSYAGNSPTAALCLRPSGGGPFTADAVNRLIKRIGERARRSRFMPTCFAMAGAMR